MSKAPRDLAHASLWEESLARSRSRRRRAESGLSTPTSLLEQAPATQGLRDLTDQDAWDLSIGRSRARRRALQLQFVPGRRRVQRLSIGTIAALTAGPGAGHLTDATAAPPTSPAVPEASATGTHEHHVQLSLGSHGRHVRALQRELGIAADGRYGPHTSAAVRAFQAREHLVVDDVVGPSTLAALRRAGVGGVPSPPRIVRGGETAARRREAIARRAASPTVPPTALAPPTRAMAARGAHRGSAARGVPLAAASVATVSALDRAHRVMSLQRALGVPADGTFGQRTLAALRSAQRRHALAVDGVAGPATLRALGMSGGTIAPPPSLAAGAAEAPGLSAGGAAPAALRPQSSAPGRLPQIQHASSIGSGEGTGGAQWHPAPASRPSSSGIGGSSTTSSVPAPVSDVGTSATVARVIAAGNRIATLPYRYGGGHASFNDTAYDCSGSVSYALHGGGLISSPEDSTGLEGYGAPGPGSHVTIYANAGHAYMTIDGRRFDTAAMGSTGGSRWAAPRADNGGFVVRHPVGY
jgi:peptidoglycan hydrolase-like protein with peptidoglycan-binding domain